VPKSSESVQYPFYVALENLRAVLTLLDETAFGKLDFKCPGACGYPRDTRDVVEYPGSAYRRGKIALMYEVYGLRQAPATIGRESEPLAE